MSEVFEFDFFFTDKSKIDEKTFFQVFLPQKQKPSEKPKPDFEIGQTKNGLVYSFTFSEGQREIFKGTPLKQVLQEIQSKSKQSRPKPYILFHAQYNDFDKELSISCFKGGKPQLPYTLDGAWKTFFRHATFKEILGSIEQEPNKDETLTRMVEFEEAFKKGKQDEAAILALQIMRDNPCMLLNKDYAIQLINILEAVRWSTNKKKKDKALKLLKDLLPQRPGGKIPVPQNIRAIKNVVEKLAVHLSDRCKKAIDCLESKKELLDDEYKLLIEWAKQESEYRISRLSTSELSNLVFRPSVFVQDTMETYLKTSQKTMRRRMDN